MHLPGALPASRRQSFGLETGRKMRFCSFKPPGLTRFVTAAQDSAAEPGNSAGTSHVLVPGAAFKSSEGPRVAASHTLRQTRGRPRSDVTAGPSHWASPLPETKRSDAFLEGQGSGSPRGDKAQPSTRTSAKAKTFFPSLISLSTELTRDCPFTTMIDSDTLSVVSGDILFLNFFFFTFQILCNIILFPFNIKESHLFCVRGITKWPARACWWLSGSERGAAVKSRYFDARAPSSPRKAPRPAVGDLLGAQSAGDLRERRRPRGAGWGSSGSRRASDINTQCRNSLVRPRGPRARASAEAHVVLTSGAPNICIFTCLFSSCFPNLFHSTESNL